MKVGIYIPTHDERVPVQYAHKQVPRELLALVKAGHSPTFMDASTCDLVMMRNEALETARTMELDYLCMQDSDVYGPEGAPLAALVELAVDKGAAMTAACVGLRRLEIGRVQANVKPFRAGEVYEADEVGTGMVCISIAEIERIAQEYNGPWFARTYRDARDSEAHVGLDIFLSRLLRAFDGSIWVDGGIETVHAYRDHDQLRFYGAMANVVETLDD